MVTTTSSSSRSSRCRVDSQGASESSSPAVASTGHTAASAVVERDKSVPVVVRPAAEGFQRGRAGAGPLRHCPAGQARGGDAVGVRAPVPADRRAMPPNGRAGLGGHGCAPSRGPAAHHPPPARWPRRRLAACRGGCCSPCRAWSSWCPPLCRLVGSQVPQDQTTRRRSRGRHRTRELTQRRGCRSGRSPTRRLRRRPSRAPSSSASAES